MTFSTFASPGVGLQGGGGGGTASLPISGNGATITTSTPLIDGTQTWNASGVTFTGLKFNAAGSSDANSAAASLLMDLQVGGSSRFKVDKAGLTRPSGIALGTDEFGGTNANWWSTSALNLRTTSSLAFSYDLFLTRRAAANLRLGAADAAAPVAQTLSVQSVVAGTSNTAGANLTITGSQGTGTGAGGSIILQVAPAGSSGTAQNALATALTIAASKVITVADTYDLAFSTSTGTKIGTATTQKLAFYNATPVVQPTAVADATDAASVITQLNALLSRMRNLGIIAT